MDPPEENQNIYEFTANKNYVKNQSNLTRFNFISASSNTLSASYYHFARINFYLSGSDLSLNEKRFNKIQTPGNLQNNDLTHFNKFYQEGSLVFVPQNEFGDTMKKGTFVLRDNSTSTEIKIIDDLNGNLYAPDATFSQSVSALSSSDLWFSIELNPMLLLSLVIRQSTMSTRPSKAPPQINSMLSVFI